MLQFLAAAAPFLSKAAPIIQGVGSLVDAIGGGNNKSYNRAVAQSMQPTQAEARANSLIEALLQPDNTLVKQNTNENMRAGMEALLSQLRTMQTMDSRRMARGQRGTFFDPSRRDEAIDSMLSRGAPFIQENARQSARKDILNSANAIKGFIPQQQQRQKNMLIDAEREQLSGGRFGQAQQVLGGVENLLKQLSALKG